MKYSRTVAKAFALSGLLSASMLFSTPSARGSEMTSSKNNKIVPIESMSTSCPPILQGSYPKLQDETPQALCQFSGQVILVVNTASYCGFTRQYDGLERLYERYKARGFVILGYPSNDFGQQEPDNNKKIADFCRNTYGIKFPMFAKSTVRGADANSLFKQLAAITGERPSWNFHKYLISRDGQQVLSFGSQIAPESKALTESIEKFLQVKP